MIKNISRRAFSEEKNCAIGRLRHRAKNGPVGSVSGRKRTEKEHKRMEPVKSTAKGRADLKDGKDKGKYPKRQEARQGRKPY